MNQKDIYEINGIKNSFQTNISVFRLISLSFQAVIAKLSDAENLNIF